MKTNPFIAFAFAFAFAFAISLNADGENIDTIFVEVPGNFVEIISKHEGKPINRNIGFFYDLHSPKFGMGQLTPAYWKRYNFRTGSYYYNGLPIIEVKIKGEEDSKVIGYSHTQNALIYIHQGNNNIENLAIEFIKAHISKSEPGFIIKGALNEHEKGRFFESIFYGSNDPQKEAQRDRILKRMRETTAKTITQYIPMECIGIHPKTLFGIFKYSTDSYIPILIPDFMDYYIMQESNGRYDFGNYKTDSIFSESLRHKFMQTLDELTEE